jgi:hypothetical protein
MVEPAASATALELRALSSADLLCAVVRARPSRCGCHRRRPADLRLGHSNAEIAARRSVAVRTIANQVAALFRKLGVHSRLDAARLAAECTSPKVPRAVYIAAHSDSPVAQVSERSDSVGEQTPFRPVDRMG